MELSHSFTVPAPIEDAWATFMDLDRVGGCFPGATITEVTEDSFSGAVKVKLGPIALVYTGSGSFLERDDSAHRAVIQAKGKDKRGNGTAGATVTVQLAADGAGTRADVTTDLAITGKPAQFGRGVMQDVSDKLLGQFVACVEGQFASGGAEAANADAPAAPSPPTGGSTADEVPADASSEAVASASPPAAAVATPAVVPDAGPVPASAAAARPAPAVRPAARSAPAGGEDALDLGGAVVPVLLKSYLPYGILTAVGVVIGYLIGRRRLR